MQSSALPANAVQADTRAQWRRWLQSHHTQTTGLWLVMWKKASGRVQLAYDAAVEEALCFGWVDSKAGKLDEHRSLLWFAPRKAGTGWSAPNKQRVQRLIESGAMAGPGLAKVHAAQADGSWSLLDAVEALVLPDDLAQALAAVPAAAEHWHAFPRSAKRGILEWITLAKTAATRSKRVDETARLAGLNQRANQWKPKIP